MYAQPFVNEGFVLGCLVAYHTCAITVETMQDNFELCLSGCFPPILIRYNWVAWYRCTFNSDCCSDYEGECISTSSLSCQGNCGNQSEADDDGNVCWYVKL